MLQAATPFSRERKRSVTVVMMTWMTVGPGRLQHRLVISLNWVSLSHFYLLTSSLCML